MKEKKCQNTRGGGGEGKTGAGGGEGKTVEGVDNRSRANSSGSLGSLDSMGEESGEAAATGVLPVGDNLDNLDWVPDYDVGDETVKAAREHRSKLDYLEHFKVRLSSRFVTCMLERMIFLWGVGFRLDW